MKYIEFIVHSHTGTRIFVLQFIKLTFIECKGIALFVVNQWQDTLNHYLLLIIIVVTTIHEDVLFSAVSMQVAEHDQTALLVYLLDKLLDVVDGGVDDL